MKTLTGLWNKLSTVDIIILMATIICLIFTFVFHKGISAYFFSVFTCGIGWLLNVFFRKPKTV